MHYRREAARNQDDAKEHDRLTAQASRSGRDARGYLAALDRAQKTRTKRESSRASAELAEIIEENGRRLMLAALSDPPKSMQPPPAEPETAAAAAPASPPPTPESQDAPMAGTAASPPPAKPGPATPPEPQAAPATILHLAAVPRFVPPPAKPGAARPRNDDEPVPDWAAEAEFYAKIYPDRARLIRKLGRLPANCDFGPPEPKLLRAIVTGSTPSLLELDEPDPAAEERLRRYA